MSSDRNFRNVHERYIDVTILSERQHWAKMLQIDEQALQDAVEAVGPAVEDVRTYLGIKATLAEARRPARRG